MYNIKFELYYNYHLYLYNFNAFLIQIFRVSRLIFHNHCKLDQRLFIFNIVLIQLQYNFLQLHLIYNFNITLIQVYIKWLLKLKLCHIWY